MEFGTAATELFLLLLPFHSSFSRRFFIGLRLPMCRKHFVIVPPPLREREMEGEEA